MLHLNFDGEGDVLDESPGANTVAVKGAIPDPAWFCAYQFRKVLTKKGITVGQKATTCRLNGANGKQRQIIYTQHSEPLKEIIKLTNYKSINIIFY